MIKAAVVLGAVLSGCALFADTVLEEDFTRLAELPKTVRTNGGKASLFTEDGNWNHCAKLEVVKISTDKAGRRSIAGAIWFGGEERAGFDVKGDTEYEFSFELRGSAPSANVDFVEWCGPDYWKDLKTKKALGKVRLQHGWTVYRGTFRPSVAAQRIALQVQLYSSEAYGPLDLKEGDYVLVDNVKIAEAKKKDLKELAARLGAPFAIAAVDACEPMTLPFLPDSLFAAESTKEFRLTAAENEVKALPIAIANLTDRAAEYRVVVETVEGRMSDREDRYYEYEGHRGLKDFPSGQVVFRHAVAIKDSDAQEFGLVLDPLPKMDETCTIAVPPGEARVVWFDFDTTGVAAGEYRGRLRVLPLAERGEWNSTGGFDNRTYVGAGRDYPVSLEVLPIKLDKNPERPYGFFQRAVNRPMFEAMYALGAREFGISPYAFGKGGLKHDDIRNELEWAKAHGSKLRWFIGFSAYHSLGDVTGGAKFKDDAEHIAAFIEWLKMVKGEMNGLGIADEDWMVETWDEIPEDRLDLAFACHTAVKKALPTVRLALTLGAQGLQNGPVAILEKLAPVTDAWIAWDYGYFSREDHREFFRKELAAGKRVSHYTCSTRSSMLRGDRYHGYRLRSWLAEANNLSAHDLFWFSDAAGGYGAQDFKACPWGQVCYRSFDDFVPSVRAMAYREGQTDMKYLAALRRDFAAHPKVKAFLAMAGEKVYYALAHDRTAADRFRKAAAKLYLQLAQLSNFK